MKKFLINVGILLLFYGIIIGGVLLLNLRFAYLNDTVLDTNCISVNN